MGEQSVAILSWSVASTVLPIKYTCFSHNKLVNTQDHYLNQNSELNIIKVLGRDQSVGEKSLIKLASDAKKV